MKKSDIYLLLAGLFTLILALLYFIPMCRAGSLSMASFNAVPQQRTDKANSGHPKPALTLNDEKLADAIYLAEGGAKTKYPYGIKSVNTYGDKNVARKICLNTIRNNKLRFLKQNKYKDFVAFLGSRYCPPSAHKLNKNWVKNVKYFYTKDESLQ